MRPVVGGGEKHKRPEMRYPQFFVLSFNHSVLTLELLAGKDWGLAIIF